MSQANPYEHVLEQMLHDVKTILPWKLEAVIVGKCLAIGYSPVFSTVVRMSFSIHPTVRGPVAGDAYLNCHFEGEEKAVELLRRAARDMFTTQSHYMRAATPEEARLRFTMAVLMLCDLAEAKVQDYMREMSANSNRFTPAVVFEDDLPRPRHNVLTTLWHHLFGKHEND